MNKTGDNTNYNDFSRRGWVLPPRSRIRMRILEESIAYNRREQRQASCPRKKQQWAKRPKYQGFQSVLDLNDNLRALPSAKKQRRHPPVVTHDPQGQTSDDEELHPWRGLNTENSSTESLEVEDPLVAEIDQVLNRSAPGTANQDQYESNSGDKLNDIPEPLHRNMAGEWQPKMLIPESMLAAELKEIYEELVFNEDMCIINNKFYVLHGFPEKWSIFSRNRRIYHHYALLQRHSDFFLASQHPSASPVLRGLAAKYNMPERMWQHGIQSFLEILRHHPTNPLGHMRTYVDSASAMISMLEESVPDSADDWAEIRKALDDYRSVLWDLDCPYMADQRSPYCSQGSSTNRSQSTSSPEADIPSNVLADIAMEGNAGGGDPSAFFSNEYPTFCEVTDSPEPINTHRDSDANERSLPSHVFHTLLGWMHFGQGIASSSRTYCKVFTLFAFTNECGNFFNDSLFDS